MQVVIVEDEVAISARIERFAKELITVKPLKINVFHTLDDADEFLTEHAVDLLFLDLNLSGLNGFDLLKKVQAESFHTIVISAYENKALEAFEYGVLDFIAKPFIKDRFCKALDRYFSAFRQNQTKYLAIKSAGQINTLPLSEVIFFKAANIYSDVFLSDGSCLLHDKPMHGLEKVLPDNFIRVHKSFIVNLQHVTSLNRDGNKIEVTFSTGAQVPVSRTLYPQIKDLFV